MERLRDFFLKLRDFFGSCVIFCVVRLCDFLCGEFASVFLRRGCMMFLGGGCVIFLTHSLTRLHDFFVERFRDFC